MIKISRLVLSLLISSFTNAYAGNQLLDSKSLLSIQNSQQALFITHGGTTAGHKNTNLQKVIEINPPYKGRFTSDEKRIEYTNNWLDALSNACKYSFEVWHDELFNKYATEKIKYAQGVRKMFKYRKLKDKTIEWEDHTYVDSVSSYNKFMTASRSNQLSSISYPTKQLWYAMYKLDGNGLNNLDEPGRPEMALDKETVKQYMYERTNTGKLESLSLCYVNPVYSLILGHTIKKFSKRATIDELWNFINPINLLKDSE